jgi:hypothetical protein
MSELLKKTDFDPHLNSKFEVYTEYEGLVAAELVEVSEHNQENLECFSLLFKVPKEKFFDQKTYKVNHAKMGEIKLFLTAVVHRDQEALYYESVFNRLIEK